MSTRRSWAGVAVVALVVTGCASTSAAPDAAPLPEPYAWSPLVAAVDSAVTSVQGKHLVSARVYAVRAVPLPDAVLAAFEELLLDHERVAHMATRRAWAKVGDPATLQFRDWHSGRWGSLEVRVDPRPGRTSLRFEWRRVQWRGAAVEVEADARADLTLDLVPGHVAVVTVPASTPHDVFFLVFVGVQ